MKKGRMTVLVTSIAYNKVGFVFRRFRYNESLIVHQGIRFSLRDSCKNTTAVDSYALKHFVSKFPIRRQKKKKFKVNGSTKLLGVRVRSRLNLPIRRPKKVQD